MFKVGSTNLPGKEESKTMTRNRIMQMVLCCSVWMLATANTGATPIVLIDEEFTNGAQPTDNSIVTWTHSDPSSVIFETYKAAKADEREMSNTYDDDQDANTPEIDIPGGLEVNVNTVDTGPMTLTAILELPADLGNNHVGYMTLFAGRRQPSRGDAGTMKITNGTGNITYFPETQLSVETEGSEPYDWVFNEFAIIDLSGASGGDELKVIWYGGGTNGGDGLQLADIHFELIPEPGAGWLSALVFLALLLLRPARPARSTSLVSGLA